ncbi:KilA N-domain protein [Moumouvirus australiensis]|uniref:KilA N-domain protein n=1 Tax=Moumouvirus australiensis TaxID=2109587 RepID=A0A2P1EKU1_9VIRU|nr:KilA N-domain protein [Moumouvirus australiensis]AVL94490.1 KilA N-domain protein [Moumouvirus australiensis]
MVEKKVRKSTHKSGSKSSKPVYVSEKIKKRQKLKNHVKVDSDTDSSESEIISYKRSNKKFSKKYDFSSESENSDNEIESETQLDKYSNESDFRNVIFENINEEYALGKFGNLEVVMMRENGFVNATNLCKKCGKDYKNWKRNDNSKELIKEIVKRTNLSLNKILIPIKGGFNIKVRGTYVHPLLLTNIANWISPLFAIKISVWIEEWKNYSLKNSVKYYKALSKLEPNSNNNKEKIIQKTLQSELGGEIEVKTKYGYIDLLTNDKIIEIKSYETWKHALGQILIYSDEYENKDKCVYLFDVPENVDTKNIKRIFSEYDVSVNFIYK